MTAYFGFKPSETLKNNIETAFYQAKFQSSVPLYIVRDQIYLGITNELINTALTELAFKLPPSDKKETMEKLSNFIHSTMSSLTKQLLGKDENEKTYKFWDYLAITTHPKDGELRVGFLMPDHLIIRLKELFAKAQTSGISQTLSQELVTLQKQMADLGVKHFVNDSCETLNLGFFKRNVMVLAQSAITKSVHFAINKLVPSLTPEELSIFSNHYDGLLYLAD